MKKPSILHVYAVAVFMVVSATVFLPQTNLLAKSPAGDGGGGKDAGSGNSSCPQWCNNADGSFALIPEGTRCDIVSGTVDGNGKGSCHFENNRVCNGAVFHTTGMLCEAGSGGGGPSAAGGGGKGGGLPPKV